MMIHPQTKLGDIGSGRSPENFDQMVTDVIRQLTRHFILPAVGNFFEIERRKSALNTIFKSKIKLRRLKGVPVTQDGSRFARIVIAVVEEENNLTTDCTLQPSCGPDFRKQKTLREKPTGLLAETNDGSCHVSRGVLISPATCKKACRTTLRITQAVQPI